MRSYQLFLIEEEFASHYFGRERMFYQLFREHSHSMGEMKSIISRQIDYITKPIPVLRIHQFLHQQMSKLKGFRAEQGIYYYVMPHSKSTATLKVHDRWLLVESQGNHDAETVFFEVLRKCETSFLAMDVSAERCGWLKPIKERKFV
ncbi:sporulation inhibitor of replication protein SirA [Mesobacillus foraminis]|uniref:sporulation inhibitor of replication protein SirA n=1 Tax=Mesobacillus foraminis TaxID=279826 RepID=UPI001BEA96CB|nr:sporulation inhibitor of replication protein SirA [Mesobacillus foraminis]MBT2755910.1 sporulation inhibitor of replication protein SirA [Mesobacillus foraminis]